LHVERLVGPLVFVVFDEIIEPWRAAAGVFSGWLGGLQLQGPTHSLMSAALLRMGGLDALDLLGLDPSHTLFVEAGTARRQG
jgi:hypothetical protein